MEICSTLITIEKLIDDNQYLKAEQSLKKIADNQYAHDKHSQFKFLHLKAKIFAYYYKYKEVLRLSEEMIDLFDQDISYHDMLGVRLKIYALNSLERYADTKILIEELINRVDVIYDNKKEKGYLKILGDLWHSKGVANYFVNELEMAKEAWIRALEYRKKADLIREVEESLNNLGIINYRHGHPEKAIIYFNESIKFAFKTNNLLGISQTYGNLSSIYLTQNDIQMAIYCLEKALEYGLELGDEKLINHNIYKMASIYSAEYNLKGAEKLLLKYIDINLGEDKNNATLALAFNSLGILYHKQGDLQRAMDHYQEGLIYISGTENKQTLPMLNHNLGLLHRQIGEIDIAEKYFSNCIEIYELSQDIKGMSSTASELAKIYELKGNYSETEKLLKMVVEIEQKRNDKMKIITSDYYLFKYYIDRGDIKSAKEKYSEIVKLSKESDHKGINLVYNLATGIYYKAFNSLRFLVKAQTYLLRVVHHPIIEFDHFVTATLYLCELYILEFKIYRSDKIISKIGDLLNKVYEIAEIHNSYVKVVEILIFRSRIYLIEAKYEQARLTLENALNITRKKELHFLERKLLEEMEEFDEAITNMANEALTLNKYHQYLHELKVDELLTSLILVEKSNEQ